MEKHIKSIESSKALAVKICGMKESDNILEIAALNPQYLGFIFAKKSPRYFQGVIPTVPKEIQKVGVFVDESVEVVLQLAALHQLQAVQLHGKESVAFCQQVKEGLDATVKIIKVFSVGETFDFEELKPFEDVSDYFLLDTKGKFPGGNGTKFDWHVLEKYNSKTPFFLSGGIGVADVEAIQQLRKTNVPLYAIDCNSKLEISAGIKNKEQCKELLEHFADKL